MAAGRSRLLVAERLYNFGTQSFGVEEAPGIFVFARNPDGEIFHTYSCYSRGLDGLNPAYQLLDLVPDGRDEADLAYPMAWLKLRDEYRTRTRGPGSPGATGGRFEIEFSRRWCRRLPAQAA